MRLAYPSTLRWRLGLRLHQLSPQCMNCCIFIRIHVLFASSPKSCIDMGQKTVHVTTYLKMQLMANI